MLKLPVWFPGATLKRMAIQAKSNLHEMIDVPFTYARNRVVKHSFISITQLTPVRLLHQRTCVSGPCMVAESLKRFPEANSEGFELALKSSSATAFIGQLEYVYICFLPRLTRNVNSWR